MLVSQLIPFDKEYEEDSVLVKVGHLFWIGKSIILNTTWYVWILVFSSLFHNQTSVVQLWYWIWIFYRSRESLVFVKTATSWLSFLKYWTVFNVRAPTFKLLFFSSQKWPVSGMPLQYRGCDYRGSESFFVVWWFLQMLVHGKPIHFSYSFLCSTIKFRRTEEAPDLVRLLRLLLIGTGVNVPKFWLITAFFLIPSPPPPILHASHLLFLVSPSSFVH